MTELLRTHFSEIWIENEIFSFMKMHLKRLQNGRNVVSALTLASSYQRQRIRNHSGQWTLEENDDKVQAQCKLGVLHLFNDDTRPSRHISRPESPVSVMFIWAKAPLGVSIFSNYVVAISCNDWMSVRYQAITSTTNRWRIVANHIHKNTN